MRQKVESRAEEESARDEVETEGTYGAEGWYWRTQWESTKCDPLCDTHKSTGK